jgi:hypothetical protein
MAAASRRTEAPAADCNWRDYGDRYRLRRADTAAIASVTFGCLSLGMLAWLEVDPPKEPSAMRAMTHRQDSDEVEI